MSFPEPSHLEPLIAKALGPVLEHAEEVRHMSMGSMALPAPPLHMAEVAPGVSLRFQIGLSGGGTVSVSAGNTVMVEFNFPPPLPGVTPGYDCASISSFLAIAVSQSFGHVLSALATFAALSGVPDEEAVHSLRLAMARSVHSA